MKAIVEINSGQYIPSTGSKISSHVRSRKNGFYEWSLKPVKSGRSINQNSTLHMWLYDLSNETGHSYDELKDMACEALGYGEYIEKSIIINSKGEVRKYRKFERRSTADLDTLECTNIMKEIEKMLIWNGVFVRYP